MINQNTALSNLDVIDQIGIELAKSLPKIKPERYKSLVEVVPDKKPKVKYWSISFSVLLRFQDNGCDEVFVKIPKMDRNERRIIKAIQDPLAQRDAEEEFESLNRLFDFSQSIGSPYRCIEPIALIHEWNAIVTQRIKAKDLYLLLRDELSAGLCGRLSKQVGLCGEWLRLMHDRFENTPIEFNTTKSALSDSTKLFDAICSNSQQVDPIIRLQNQHTGLMKILGNVKIPVAMSIPGFEVRNIMVDDQAIYVLDPRRVRMRETLLDVATFLVSLDTLFSGTLSYLWKKSAMPYYGNLFLTGYYGDEEYDRRVLWLFVFQQFLRYWRNAYQVLESKRLPGVIKKFIGYFYIERPFLRKLEKLVQGI